MDHPCKTCQRQETCDHYSRCKRWCDWFADQWLRIQALFGENSG